MQYFEKLVVFMFVTIVLQACTSTKAAHTSRFFHSWKYSLNNSAVSFWYIGETERYYYIEERRPFVNYIYVLSKRDVEISKVAKMFPCKSVHSCTATNLKSDMVKFIE